MSNGSGSANTSGTGRDPPDRSRIHIPGSFANPTENAYVQGFQTGWTEGVDQYLNKFSEEGYYIFVRTLLKADVLALATDGILPEANPWDPTEREWVTKNWVKISKFLESSGSYDGLRVCLKHAKAEFLKQAIGCLREALKQDPVPPNPKPQGPTSPLRPGQ